MDWRSQHNHAPRGRPTVCGMPQFSPITGRPQCGYVKCTKMTEGTQTIDITIELR